VLLVQTRPDLTPLALSYRASRSFLAVKIWQCAESTTQPLMASGPVFSHIVNTARRHKRPDTRHIIRLPSDVGLDASRGAKHIGVQARRGGDFSVVGSLCGPSSCTSWCGGRAGRGARGV